MEIIIEILGEIILGGSFEVINDTKTPKWLRILLLVVMSAFYLGFAGLLLWISMGNASIALKGIMIFVAILLFACFVHLWYKVLKSRKR